MAMRWLIPVARVWAIVDGISARHHNLAPRVHIHHALRVPINDRQVAIEFETRQMKAFTLSDSFPGRSRKPCALRNQPNLNTAGQATRCRNSNSCCNDHGNENQSSM
jgi:hypothetical protein